MPPATTEAAAPASSPAAAPSPVPPKRLPTDPELRAAALAPMREEAAALVRMVDGILARYLPPPLVDAEQAMLVEPLAEVLWKYDGHLPCELMLGLAALAVFGPRIANARQAAKDKAAAELAKDVTPLATRQP